MLVAGERRLAACKSLGWQKVPVTIINIEAIVHGEFAENVHRKDFLLSEIDAIRRAMEPIVRAAAKDAHARESKQTVCIVIVATVLRETANSQVLRP